MQLFPRGLGLRERRHAYFGFAAVILGTSAVDLAVAGEHALLTIPIRMVWAAAFVVAALSLRRFRKGALLALVLGLIALDIVSFVSIALLSGGTESWMFYIFPLLPLFVAFSDHDDNRPALAAGIGTGVSGLAVILADGHGLPWCTAWVALVGASTGWAIAGVHRVGRMHRDAELRRRDLQTEVDERRASELLVLQRHGELLQILSRLPVGVGIWRIDRFVYVNATYAAWLGYESADEILRLTLLEMVHPDDRERGAQEMARGGPHEPMEFRILRKDGGAELFELNTVGQVQFEGEPATLVVNLRKTERQQMQQRLILADRMASLGTLAAGVAHEINNPLAFISSNLDVLADEMRSADLSAGSLELVEQSREGVQRVARIVRDLNVFSRGESSAAARAVDVRAAIASARTMMQHQIRHRARLELDLAELPPVRGNEPQLAQVFVNLLANAVQAIPDSGTAAHRVGVKAFALSAGEVAIEVFDTGVGIPAEALPRIFEPFFTTKPVGQGTGLGLSICHGIVAALGGRIEVRSQPGEGTTVRVVLQVAEEFAPAALAAAAPAAISA